MFCLEFIFLFTVLDALLNIALLHDISYQIQFSLIHCHDFLIFHACHDHCPHLELVFYSLLLCLQYITYSMYIIQHQQDFLFCSSFLPLMNRLLSRSTFATAVSPTCIRSSLHTTIGLRTACSSSFLT